MCFSPLLSNLSSISFNSSTSFVNFNSEAKKLHVYFETVAKKFHDKRENFSI